MRQCPRCHTPADDRATYCPHDGALLEEVAPPSSPDEELVGQEVGHYRVTALLGTGGMGAVYLGVHPAIGSRVAIKVLHPDLARDREAVRRFFAEARAVNLVRHENIINIIDLAELPDGRSYIVMEYLEGESLGARLRERGPFAARDAVAVMLPLLAALQAAHEHGVVHRDLKPDNVFLTREGRVKVLDFGIAKLDVAAGGGSLTRTGAIVGTPLYMSPEQAMGRTGEVDRCSDIYSAGVILYELLTGRAPFKAATLVELISKHALEAPPPLRTLQPALPVALEAVVMRALAKERAARWGNAAEMAAALERALAAGAEAEAVAPTLRAQSAAATPPPVAVTPTPEAATPAPVAGTPAPAAATPAPAAEPRARAGRRALIALAIGVVVLAGGAAAWWRLANHTAAGAEVADLRRRLDAALAGAREPSAPAGCRTADLRTLAALAPAAEALADAVPRGARPQDAQALTRLEAAPAGARQAAEYWYLLGRARLAAGREPAAVAEAAQAALARCADLAAAHNLAGTAAFVAGRDEEALGHYRRAAALAGDYATPRVNQALVLLRRGRVPDAVAALDEVLGREPDHADARLARGQAYLMEGEVARAARDLEATVRRTPKNATAHLLLGEAYAKLERDGEAQAELCRSKALGNPRAAELCRAGGDAGVPAPGPAARGR